MLDIKDDQLEIVKSILKNNVSDVEARVYGSRVTGNIKPYSDLDLVLVGENKISREVMMHIKDAFQESELPFRVDIQDWNKLTEQFRKIISEKYVVLDLNC